MQIYERTFLWDGENGDLILFMVGITTEIYIIEPQKAKKF